jgi:uncharacterized protein (DUF58 family)
MSVTRRISPDVLNKMRMIEIQTRRLLSGTQVGNYNTANKGTGLEFDQLREYQEGDDVRFIDWSGSARAQRLLVRQYFEERNRTILLIVDNSPSTKFGSTSMLKSELIAQLASVLALVANYGKDAVGLIHCKDTVHYIPPSRGIGHVHRIMEELFTENAAARSYTSMREGLEKWLASCVKRPLIIMISDFIDSNLETVLPVVANRAEVIAVRCLDPLERSLPVVGMVRTKDIEHGTAGSLMVSGKAQQERINQLLKERLDQQTLLFKSYGIELIDVAPGTAYLGPLITFFRKRRMY